MSSATSDHPAIPRLVHQAREDNPDWHQRDAARVTLFRITNGDPPEYDGLAEPEYPSLATMASNAVRAAIGFAADGFNLASDEEQDRRLEICRACPAYDAKRSRCTKCGCYAGFKAKLASSACPDVPPRW